jgi:hypothetical protein
MNNKFLTGILLLLSLLIIIGNQPVLAAQEPISLPVGPQPLTKTVVELKKQEIVLDWQEETTLVKGLYSLTNPTNKKIKVTLGMPGKNIVIDEENTPKLVISSGENNIKIKYDKKYGMYTWDLTFNPEESLELHVEYEAANTLSEQKYTWTGYEFSNTPKWTDKPVTTSLTLNFREVHPGQIKDISPGSYSIIGDSLVWKWVEQPPETNVRLIADVAGEKNTWLSRLSDQQSRELNSLLENKSYLEAANLLGQWKQKAAKEDKEFLALGQAYYLEKSGKSEEANKIWEDLFEDEAKSPRVYWTLTKNYKKSTGKLTDIYQRVRELQIHPFLQNWLVHMLPPGKVKLSSPEKNPATASYVEEGKNGVLLKGNFADPDGDIEKIVLRFRWEDGKAEEKEIPLEPFRYEHNISAFLPAPGPLQRLFYEFMITDASGNKVSTGEKETFYLNSDITSETFSFVGAKLVLGEYTPEEQDKVYKWFKSYMKMAKEAGFVPIEAKSPYFIFLGEFHEITRNYQGPFFMMYTPAPFAPDQTKLAVHRYFLSYWYGPGWHTLPAKEAEELGDALLLGKGYYVQSLKYLNHKDPKKFAMLLAKMGEGKDWVSSLQEVFNLTPTSLFFRVIWYVYGNMVLAFVIIITFAWLGKTGHLVRFVHMLKSK